MRLVSLFFFLFKGGRRENMYLKKEIQTYQIHRRQSTKQRSTNKTQQNTTKHNTSWWTGFGGKVVGARRVAQNDGGCA